MRVTRVQHVSVNVHGQLEAARAFYGDLLGLPEITRPEIPGIGGAWFDIGGTQLHLVDARTRANGPDPVAHHFCVWVEDLDAAIAELDAAGVAYERGTQESPSGPVTQIWIQDPSGSTIELQQDR